MEVQQEKQLHLLTAEPECLARAAAAVAAAAAAAALALEPEFRVLQRLLRERYLQPRPQLPLLQLRDAQ